MDPVTCLELARLSLLDKDGFGAVVVLEGYLEWRKKGGCEPYKGADLRALEFSMKAANLIEYPKG